MTDKINDGGPAFPFMTEVIYEEGMSLRQYTAIHAPDMTEQRWLDSKDDNYSWPEADASWRFHWADAMIAESEKGGEG